MNTLFIFQDLEPITGTLGTRQEYTLYGTPIHHQSMVWLNYTLIKNYSSRESTWWRCLRGKVHTFVFTVFIQYNTEATEAFVRWDLLVYVQCCYGNQCSNRPLFCDLLSPQPTDSMQSINNSIYGQLVLCTHITAQSWNPQNSVLKYCKEHSLYFMLKNEIQLQCNLLLAKWTLY